MCVPIHSRLCFVQLLWGEVHEIKSKSFKTLITSIPTGTNNYTKSLGPSAVGSLRKSATAFPSSLSLVKQVLCWVAVGARNTASDMQRVPPWLYQLKHCRANFTGLFTLDAFSGINSDFRHRCFCVVRHSIEHRSVQSASVWLQRHGSLVSNVVVKIRGVRSGISRWECSALCSGDLFPSPNGLFSQMDLPWEIETLCQRKTC